MTDNERKAAIETMAAKLFALEEYPNAPEESHPEDLWGLITEASRILWRKKAEVALESIGYFDIVTAAKKVADNAKGCEKYIDQDDVNHFTINDLKSALKCGGITLARP